MNRLFIMSIDFLINGAIFFISTILGKEKFEKISHHYSSWINNNSESNTIHRTKAVTGKSSNNLLLLAGTWLDWRMTGCITAPLIGPLELVAGFDLSNLCGPIWNLVPFTSCALFTPLGGLGLLSTYASLVLRTEIEIRKKTIKKVL